MTQNYESWTPDRSEQIRGKTKFKSKFAESLQNIYTFSSRPLRGSREACEDKEEGEEEGEEEISEKDDVRGSRSLAGSDKDVRMERDGEKLESLADSNCEVEIIRSSLITSSHLIITTVAENYHLFQLGQARSLVNISRVQTVLSLNSERFRSLPHQVGGGDTELVALNRRLNQVTELS